MCTVQISTLYKILIIYISVNLRCIWRVVSLLVDIESSNLFAYTLQWRHNRRDGVSNRQPHDCLLNRLIRRRSKKTSKLRVTGLGIHRGPVNSPHKWPVTRKMFPFDDVIMYTGVYRLLDDKLSQKKMPHLGLTQFPPWRKWPPFRRRYVQMHFHERKFSVFIKMSLKFVPRGPMDNNPALVYIMAWRRIGYRPLSELLLTEFTEAYIRN